MKVPVKPRSGIYVPFSASKRNKYGNFVFIFFFLSKIFSICYFYNTVVEDTLKE